MPLKCRGLPEEALMYRFPPLLLRACLWNTQCFKISCFQNITAEINILYIQYYAKKIILDCRRVTYILNTPFLLRLFWVKLWKEWRKILPLSNQNKAKAHGAQHLLNSARHNSIKPFHHYVFDVHITGVVHYHINKLHVCWVVFLFLWEHEEGKKNERRRVSQCEGHSNNLSITKQHFASHIYTHTDCARSFLASRDKIPSTYELKYF